MYWVDVLLVLSAMLAAHQLLPLLADPSSGAPSCAAVVVTYWRRRAARLLPGYLLANLLVLLALGPAEGTSEQAAAARWINFYWCPGSLWANLLFAQNWLGTRACGELQEWQAAAGGQRAWRGRGRRTAETREVGRVEQVGTAWQHKHNLLSIQLVATTHWRRTSQWRPPPQPPYPTPPHTPIHHPPHPAPSHVALQPHTSGRWRCRSSSLPPSRCCCGRCARAPPGSTPGWPPRWQPRLPGAPPGACGRHHESTSWSCLWRTLPPTSPPS